MKWLMHSSFCRTRKVSFQPFMKTIKQAFSLVRHYPTHIGYSRHPSPTSVPTGTVPATPILFPYKIHLPLPLSPILLSTQPSIAPTPLATRITTPPEPWLQPLWHDIWPHAHSDTLWQVLLTNTRIHLVSDAAVHPNGTGTCAWTIWAHSEVWSGEGYVPGAVMDMYSGLAEVYRIYTVLSFLHHYLTLYPIIILPPHTIHAHCNNSGIIDWINKTSQCTYPWDAIRDDYPIYTEIQALLKALSSIRVLFHHVKGHQKETAERKLTLPEQLNIDCDKRASRMITFR